MSMRPLTIVLAVLLWLSPHGGPMSGTDLLHFAEVSNRVLWNQFQLSEAELPSWVMIPYDGVNLTRPTMETFGRMTRLDCCEPGQVKDRGSGETAIFQIGCRRINKKSVVVLLDVMFAASMETNPNLRSAELLWMFSGDDTPMSLRCNRREEFATLLDAKFRRHQFTWTVGYSFDGKYATGDYDAFATFKQFIGKLSGGRHTRVVLSSGAFEQTYALDLAGSQETLDAMRKGCGL